MAGMLSILTDAVTVWIDPLDATQEYTEGDKDLLKFVTVMVCIAIKGKPIAGIIHQPYDADGNSDKGGVTKWAWVGHDSSLSLTQAVEPHTAKSTDNVRVIASRSHPGDVIAIAESAFKGSGQTVEQIKAAGAGYKALQVVEGRADLYLHTTAIKKWDICAGDAILKATGGQMTTREGTEIDYSFKGSPLNEHGLVAASNTANHDQYLTKLRI
jgi:inositol monophosphatase 3